MNTKEKGELNDEKTKENNTTNTIIHNLLAECGQAL